MSSIAKIIPNLKIEVYDVLNHVFNGYQMEHNKSFRIVRSDNAPDGTSFYQYMPNGERVPNFVREEFLWKKPAYIIYEDAHIALTQSKPHGIIKIMNVNPKHTLIRNMFILSLHNNFPGVRVMYERNIVQVDNDPEHDNNDDCCDDYDDEGLPF